MTALVLWLGGSILAALTIGLVAALTALHRQAKLLEKTAEVVYRLSQSHRNLNDDYNAVAGAIVADVVGLDDRLRRVELVHGFGELKLPEFVVSETGDN